MSIWGIRRLETGKWEVAVEWGIFVFPTLGDAIRFKLEMMF